MLSRDEVKNIALLARIGLSDEEVSQYQKHLSSALDWFAQLKNIPTENVAPIGHITGETHCMRDDEAVSGIKDERTIILRNMPETKDGATKVRSVF